MQTVSQERIEEFVGKLWTNPSIRNATLVKKENQILAFLKENRKQLETAFSRPELFPGVPFDDVARQLLSVLTDTILQYITPKLDAALDRIFGSGIIGALDSEGGVDLDRAKLREFVLANMRAKSLRDPYLLAIEAVSAGIFDRYVPIIVMRRKMIYNEVIRRDRLTLDNALVPGFFNLACLYRPLYWYGFSRVTGGPGQIATLAGVARDQKVYDASLKDLTVLLDEQIGRAPERIYRAGIESCLNPGDREVGGASRLIAILMGRILDFDPAQKVDRGAESPDKSWFNINRRTAKYHGYDLRFMEELYQIAGEEAW